MGDRLTRQICMLSDQKGKESEVINLYLKKTLEQQTILVTQNVL